MRLRHIALGCALAGTFGFVALPPATALAEGSTLAPAGVLAPGGALAPGGVLPGTALTQDKPLAQSNATARGGAHVGKTAHAPSPKPRLTINSPKTDNPYGAKVTLTVTLGPTSNRAVSLYAKPAGGARTLLATGVVNAKGRWSTTYTITAATTFTAVFAGDANHAATWASRTLRAYARVADRLTGAYKTVKIGGVSYAVFHGKGTLTLYAKVWPKKQGECLEPETEQYDAGRGWDADSKYGCDKIDAASHDTAPFTLDQAVGARYRIRGDYIHSSRDTANLNAQGPWLYFTVGT